MKTIVISAVNLVEAGTLAILSECLAYLSAFNSSEEYRIVAIVHQKRLASYPNIEYIETQWPKKRWVNRLWYEYVSLKKISQEIGPIFLWVSLHDTTPSVIAERRAVYCHNSFSFYRWRIRDLLFAPKIAAFALFTKYIYQKNINKNDYLVVQQDWFRVGMSQMFSLPKEKIIVAPPQTLELKLNRHQSNMTTPIFSFVFAASPNSHKNFEVICKAAMILEKEMGKDKFKVFLTLRGDENKYAKWLYSNWGAKVSSLDFIGFLRRETLLDYYAKSHCLIFPSKVETWGLPISEFKTFDKPMLLADLPYAYETAAGASRVAFFDPEQPRALAEQMLLLIQGETSFLNPVPQVNIEAPVTHSWQELFDVLLAEKPVGI